MKHHFIKNAVRVSSFFLVLLLAVAACDKANGPSETPLKANAGADQMVIPGDVVTLNGSSSTGPSGFTYDWSYAGNVDEEDINFQNKTTATPTFTPPKSGLYVFTLVVSYDGQTSQDVVQIEASSSLAIGGVLTEDLTLVDVQIDPEKPDYILTSDLLVPAGINLIIGDDNVVIHAADEKGIILQGGTLTNAMDENSAYEPVKFTATNGWKGIQVDGGVINLQGAEIEKAGSAVFTGQDESAALVLSGTNPTIINFRDNTFVSSLSYDVLATSDVIGPKTFANNTLSHRVPIKAKITFMDTWTGISDPNHFPDDYDYVHLIPSGAGVTDAISGTFEFPQGMFYIDGDFRAGSAVQIWSGTTLLMKAGAGILAETKLTISGGWTSPAVIDGLNGVSWKGIACTPDASISISGGTIKNAGASTFNFPNFQTEANAAVYISGKSNISFSLSDFKIINSDGYGVYFDVQGTLQTSIFKGQISNTALAGIRLTAQTANYAIGSYTEIEFQMNPGVPAVLVEGQGSPSSLTWQSLGTGNYYLVDADLDFGTVRMRLNAGVHLKMASGRALVFNGDNPVFFEAFGTAENPIIIEGEDGTPGSWGGIYIESASFRMQHCTIKNGGEFILPGASEPANFVNNSRESFGTYLIQNCTFSGSAGYGFVEEYNIRNPYDVLAPELENTFSNNALGDFIKKEGGI